MRNHETRGFPIKKHLFRVSKWITGRTRSPSQGYCRLVVSPSVPRRINPMSRLLSWCRCLTSRRTKSLCSSKLGGSTMMVPKGHLAVYVGHLAVYVGRSSGEFCRVLVPVVYFNHPLFGDLLREAEEEFGFSHGGGGITIPCEISEFERVKSRIAAACPGGRRSTSKKHL